MTANHEPLRRITPLTLYEEDARFAAIFNQTSAGIAETDLSGRFMLVNPHYCEITGRSREELLALRMQDITHPDDLAGNLELFQRLVETGENFVIDKRYVRPDGSFVWVRNNVSLVRATDGSPQYALAVILDLSERNDAAQALHRSEELSRRMLEASSDCIKLLDLDGRLLAMNAPGQRQLDICDLSRHLNVPWTDFWHGEWREPAEAAVAAALSGGTGRFTGFCPTLVGTPKWWENTITPILDASGKPERLLAVSHDITERRFEDHARDLLIAAAKATGRSFFEALVKAMARAFGARYALIGERKPHAAEIIRTLAVCEDGEVVSNIEYLLAELPCREVVASGSSLYREGLRRQFPNQPLLEKWQAESYFGKPLRAANGEIIGVLAVIHDRPLTLNASAEAILEIFAGRAGVELERMRSRTKLEERELMLRVVTDHAPMLISYVDPEHRFRFSNDAYHEWFGVHDIEGRHVREVVGEDAYQQLAPRLDTALSGNDVSFEDFVPYSGHGRYVYTAYIPHRDSRGRVRGLIAIVLDVTERHRAERATEFLAEANSLLSGSLNYEQALTQITHLIVPSLADWCAVDMLKDNGAFELAAAQHWHPEKNQLIHEMREKHPLKPDSPVGVPLAARTGRAVVYSEVSEAVLREAAEDDDHFDMLRRLDIRSAIMAPLVLRGRTLAVLTLVSGESHYRFSEGDLPMLEELARRCALVVENARLYAAAQKEIAVRAGAESALHEEVRRKDDFLAILGHELRNPLAPIRNCLEIMQRSDSSREQVQKTRDTMARQVRHMGRLIDDLLEVSRISQGKIPLEARQLDLSEAVRETADDHAASLSEKSLRLKLELPAQPVWISGDPVRISQVLINLLRNAVSFTDPVGQIGIALREEEGNALITVSDNGLGMEPQLVASLFQPFAQADRTLARSRGGLGLGLTLVRGIVELHGGSVHAASAGIGLGSQFTLRLPLLTKLDTPTPAPAPRSAKLSCRRRVLVIEDNRDVAETTQALLEVLGHDVALAYDGERGLETAREFNPDVIFCDLGLPGELSGFAVARAMRANGKAPYLVAITGYGGELDRKRALSAGFDLHLCKPVGADAIEQVLAELPQ